VLPMLKSMIDRINEQLEDTKKGRLNVAAPGHAGISAGLTADTGIHSRLRDHASRGIGSGS